jgi:hypothetical protein
MSKAQSADSKALVKELEEASRLVEEYERFYRRIKPRATRERVREAGIVMFLAHAIRQKDRAGFKALAELSLKSEAGRAGAQESSRRLALEQRKLKLLEQRQAQAETVAHSNLSPEERERRWREIFGLPMSDRADRADRADGADKSDKPA